MLWKLFGSERRVEEALAQSIGYDISPNIVTVPVNDDLSDSVTPSGKDKLKTLP